MAVKFTIQGLLIYAAMTAYLLAFTADTARLRKVAAMLFAAGFAAAAGALAWRWTRLGSVPLQNLFDVFLVLGVLMWPISVLCERFGKVGGRSADILIAAFVLIPPGFALSASVRLLPPALQSQLFVPHVSAYMLATVIMAKAAVQAGAVILRGDRPARSGLVRPELAAYRMACLGFPLLTAGLLLGAIWGKLAWGDYWNWDPKEMWSLSAWLVYAGYFHFRSMFGRRMPRANATWVLTGMALIVITLLWVNLSRIFAGLHSYA